MEPKKREAPKNIDELFEQIREAEEEKAQKAVYYNEKQKKYIYKYIESHRDEINKKQNERYNKVKDTEEHKLKRKKYNQDAYLKRKEKEEKEKKKQESDTEAEIQHV